MSQGKEKGATEKIADSKKICGIIMPIASTSGYPTDHWKDVLTILTEAINETEFEPRLVSDDIAIGLIHERIVTNIYTNDIVICDVSSKNPNVMFELGLRLAFDKPTIIIKDELTGYSFDTGVIEHIPYPSSLRFSQIVKFKEELIKRIGATYEKSQNEPDFSPFLKGFKRLVIEPAKLQQKEVSETRYILAQLEILREELRMMRYDQPKNSRSTTQEVADVELEILQIIDRFASGYIADLNHFEELIADVAYRHRIHKKLVQNGYDLSDSALREALQVYLKAHKESILNSQVPTPYK